MHWSKRSGGSLATLIENLADASSEKRRAWRPLQVWALDEILTVVPLDLRFLAFLRPILGFSKGYGESK
jgi:hypothetical protein